MRKFRRRGGLIITQLTPDEVLLLQSLLAQLIEMISDGGADGGGADGGGADDGGADDGGADPGGRYPGESEPDGPDESADAPGPDEAADPFEAWAREFEQPRSVAPPEDPAMRRLFPDAYRDDPEASAEFRRFTDRDLRGRKIDDAQSVLAQLALTDGGRLDLRIATDEVEAWLRTLTNLRLAVAARLGIEDAAVAEELADLPDEDPRAYLASVYDWLGFAQETLVGAL